MEPEGWRTHEMFLSDPGVDAACAWLQISGLVDVRPLPGTFSSALSAAEQVLGTKWVF